MESFPFSPRSPMLDTPVCDSDEEVFFGPVTSKELQKASQLKRRTQFYFPSFDWNPSTSSPAKINGTSPDKGTASEAKVAVERPDPSLSADSLESQSFLTVSDKAADSSKGEFWSALSGNSLSTNPQSSFNDARFDSKFSEDSLEAEQPLDSGKLEGNCKKTSCEPSLYSNISEDSLENSKQHMDFVRVPSGWSKEPSSNSEISAEGSKDSLDASAEGGSRFTPNVTQSESENGFNNSLLSTPKVGPNGKIMKPEIVKPADTLTTTYEVLPGIEDNDTYTLDESCEIVDLVEPSTSNVDLPGEVAVDKDGGFLSILSEAALYHASQLKENDHAQLEESRSTTQSLEERFKMFGIDAGELEEQQLSSSIMYTTGRESNVLCSETENNTFYTGRNSGAAISVKSLNEQSCPNSRGNLADSSSSSSVQYDCGEIGVTNLTSESQESGFSGLQYTNELNQPMHSGVNTTSESQESAFSGLQYSNELNKPIHSGVNITSESQESAFSGLQYSNELNKPIHSGVNITSESEESAFSGLQYSNELNQPIHGGTLGSAGSTFQRSADETSCDERMHPGCMTNSNMLDQSGNDARETSDISGVCELNSVSGNRSIDSNQSINGGEPLNDVSDVSSFGGELNDTLEEYEMMMRYGVDYILGRKGNKKTADHSEAQEQGAQILHSEMSQGFSVRSPLPNQTDDHSSDYHSAASPLPCRENSSFSSVEYLDAVNVSPSSKKAENIRQTDCKVLSPMQKQLSRRTPQKIVKDVYSFIPKPCAQKLSSKLPRVASVDPNKLLHSRTPQSSKQFTRPVTPSSDTKALFKHQSKPVTPSSEPRSGLFKKPGTPATSGSRIPKTPSSQGPKSNNKILDKIQSPVGAYIHNTPLPILVTNVKAKTTDRPSYEKEMHARALWRAGEVKSAPKLGVANAENINPNVGCGLPSVKYTKAPCIKLDEATKIPSSRAGEKMTKLMDAPSPQVIKHEGRLRVNCGSPQLTAKMQSLADAFDDSLVDVHSVSGDISVCVSQQACRTNTLGHH